MTELDDLVDEMAVLLGAPCTLEDADFNLLGYSGQSDVDDVRQRSILQRRATSQVRDWFHAQGIRTSATPIRTPADPGLGISARLCIPARHLNRVQGYFWLLDPDEAISEHDWPAATRIAEIAALLLSQSTRRQTRLNLFYRDLVEGDRMTARAAAKEIAFASDLRVGDPVTCLLVEHPTPIENLSAQARRDGVVWVQESPTIAAAIVRGRIKTQAPSSIELLTRLGYHRRSRPLTAAPFVGVGPQVSALEDLRQSRWGALTALRVARANDPGQPTEWASLGVLKLLSAAADHDLAEAVVSEQLMAFLSDERHAELVHTARVYLDSAGSAAHTASVLNLHRQSLYHRLAQVERRTGLDLKRGTDRTYLHLALMLADFLLPS
ncbi:helix-turn-helix domain-containing protein [Dactylosporangium salmoneum]|uniref:PucR C-terminal helix-turn-helix domain-containing protein n=1 Tax=Dactylosporangium salmoneum TaxID=53361 RepID=A0ABN3H879_9ACTN